MLRIRHLVTTSLACVVMGLVGQAFAQTNPLVQLDYNSAKILGTVQIANGVIDLPTGP